MATGRGLSFVFTEDSFRVDRPDENSGEQEALKEAFRKNKYGTLFSLGFSAIKKGESPSLRFLHTLAETFVKDLTTQPDLEVAREWTNVKLTDEAYDVLVRSIPFGIGTENINRSWLALQYMNLLYVFSEGMRDYQGSVKMFLTEKSQNLRTPERIFFHLVESTKNEDYPFAFLATYSTKDEEGGVRHMPLSFALEEYKNDRDKLLELLSCLTKVAELSSFLEERIESGELFHPLGFTAPEAYDFLKNVPQIEKC